MIAVDPGELWSAWNLDPVVLVGLVLWAYVYAWGVSRMWVSEPGRGVSRRRVASFYGGLVVVFVALVSPLDALAATLFSAHMAQHLLLVVVAPPMLVYGAAGTALGMALPKRLRRSLLRPFNAERRRARRLALTPVVVWGLHAAVMWSWHLPAFYEAALRNDFVHALEHATMLGSALLLWVLIFGSVRRARLDHPRRAMLVFATMLQSGALGVVLALTRVPLYLDHAGGPLAWGLTPLEDQQLAGGMMWTPVGALYTVTIAVLLGRWLNGMEARMARRATMGEPQ